MTKMNGFVSALGSFSVAAATAVVAIVGIASQAKGQVTPYSNRATWQAAAAPNGGENFNSFVVDTTFQNVTVPISNGTVQGQPGSNGSQTNKIDVLPGEFTDFYIIDNSPILLGDLVNNQIITIAFTTPVSAWGGDFKGISDSGPSVRDTRINVYDPSNNLLGTVATSSSSGALDLQFYGFTLGAGQSAGRLMLSNSTSSNDVFGVDNVQFTAVPEPSGMMATLAGAGALMFGGRRRARC